MGLTTMIRIRYLVALSIATFALPFPAEAQRMTAEDGTVVSVVRRGPSVSMTSPAHPKYGRMLIAIWVTHKKPNEQAETHEVVLDCVERQVAGVSNNAFGQRYTSRWESAKPDTPAEWLLDQMCK